MPDLASNIFQKISCVICHDCSPCYGCQIKYLQQMVKYYKGFYDMINSIQNDNLKLKPYQLADIKMMYKRDCSPLPFECPNLELSKQWSFITLTFDPQKFGISNEPEGEKNYMLNIILAAARLSYISSVYGSFELHKNGTVHTHFVAKVHDQQIYSYLKKQLTDNPKNKNAVNLGPAKFPNCIKYIQKESNDYYQLDMPILEKKEEKNPLDIIVETST